MTLSVPPKDAPDGRLQLRASTVVIKDQAVAFVGASGTGKSSMALGCLGRGAQLIADDITWLRLTDGRIMAECPPSLSGQIEARGVGILNAQPAPPHPVRLVIDLGATEQSRLPDPMTISIFGQNIDLLHKVESSHFLDALYHYLLHGKAT